MPEVHGVANELPGRGGERVLGDRARDQPVRVVMVSREQDTQRPDTQHDALGHQT
jgi:hypothetical protein